MEQEEVEVHKNATKKKLGQLSPILIEQTRSKKAICDSIADIGRE